MICSPWCLVWMVSITNNYDNVFNERCCSGAYIFKNYWKNTRNSYPLWAISMYCWIGFIVLWKTNRGMVFDNIVGWALAQRTINISALTLMSTLH